MSFSPWIKIETNTPDKPEVIAMATALRMKDPDTVTGKLVRLWAWADANSIDGHDISITRAHIDRLTACRGFAGAMEKVGWLEGKDGLMSFPGFDRHNGDSAKRRATEARKKQHQRGGTKGGKKRGTNVPPPSGQKGGPEIEIDRRERESVREAQGKSPAADGDPVWGRVKELRDEWAAAPVPSEAEREALARNREALAALDAETWETMRRFLRERFAEGDARFQPRQRLLAIRSIGDLASQAMAWANGAGGVKAPRPKPWPPAFEEWVRQNYPATPARVLWLSPKMREIWENEGKEAETNA